MEKLWVFVGAVLLVNVALFILVPDPSPFQLSLATLRDSPWQLLTFQFFHLNLIHLLENAGGLLFVGFLAKELSVDFRTFALVYFASIFIIPVAMLMLYPMAAVAGDSTGIFGVLGFCLIKSRKLLPPIVSLPLFAFVTFSMTLVNFFSCGSCYESFIRSDVFHFVGFLSGLLLALALPMLPKPGARRLLLSGRTESA
jgi:membrane associated rhomboid family serine protease